MATAARTAATKSHAPSRGHMAVEVAKLETTVTSVAHLRHKTCGER
jgi:hypothetical protein